MEMFMLLISVALVAAITGYVFGRGKSYFSEEDGFFIYDDRNPEKRIVTLDINKDPEDILKKKYLIVRVVEKKDILA